MLSDSHVSEPKIIVGLHDCIIWSSSGFLLLIDWKFIVSTLSGDGLSILELFDLKVYLCIGEDWWDGLHIESWIPSSSPSVKKLFDVSIVLLKNVVAKFGIPHFSHSHDKLLLFNSSYIYWSIPWQYMWYHCSQPWQHIALCFQVTASLQAPHGYVGRPGLGSGAYNKCRCKNTAGYNVNKSKTS